MAKHYDKEFKLDAMKYREDHPELTVAAVCRNLGISQPTYYLWLKEFKENDGEIEQRGSGNYSSDLEKENARLRRELKSQKDALEILKKAIGILGEEPK
jgi:transposase